MAPCKSVNPCRTCPLRLNCSSSWPNRAVDKGDPTPDRRLLARCAGEISSSRYTGARLCLRDKDFDVNSPCRMIINVDTGSDDAMAILVLKLEALATTFGNTDTALATTNTLQMLELLKQLENPVAKGVARSLIHPYVRRADHVMARMRSETSSFRSRRSGRSTNPAISSSAWRRKVRASSCSASLGRSPTSHEHRRADYRRCA